MQVECDLCFLLGRLNLCHVPNATPKPALSHSTLEQKIQKYVQGARRHVS